MIVWLASYPRSGNTLLRQMLWQVFGCETYSQYNDSDIGGVPEVSKAVGHREFSGSWEEFYEEAATSSDRYFIKTHGRPIDNSPAIYVVRDGRSASVSYLRYVHDVNRRPEVTLEQVITGAVGFGGWSAHLDAWQPLLRPDTLMLRFEDLAIRPDLAISDLAGFLGLKPQGEWRNGLDRLREVFPAFFRTGSDAANKLDPRHTDLVESLHCPWLAKLGYFGRYS
jgi:hypothetical protein